jgi:hypothetical protein
MKKTYYILIFIIAVAIGCKKPYAPPVITSAISYLVVEGVINAGSDSTIISLSHTVSISAKTTANPQTKAIVIVESDQNVSYPLTEIPGGKYVSPGLNLDVTRQYRLRVKTPDNQQYLSDFVGVKVTPPIDSIGFNIDNTRNGLQIYANTHDPNSNTHYYRWDYQETWTFHSKYNSGYITNGTAIVPRSSNQLIYYCFAGAASSTIDIGSSAALQKDAIYQAPITLIPSTSEKIETRYSILLRQYALTGDAYNFWVNIKKNTEQLGSIFDAQPSTAAGNIHNINNAAEFVVGYISACTVQTKRVFIASSQLPKSWSPIYPYNCELDSNLFRAPPLGFNQVAFNLIPLHAGEIPVSQIFLPGNTTGQPDGYMGSDSQCVDCTIRGVTKPPSFW